jgi:hypothetical protein
MYSFSYVRTLEERFRILVTLLLFTAFNKGGFFKVNFEELIIICTINGELLILVFMGSKSRQGLATASQTVANWSKVRPHNSKGPEESAT